MRDFLLEIGVEEIPATHLQPAVEFIRQSFEALMGKSRLSYGTLKISSTPRRLFVLATGMEEKQEDLHLCRTGPARKIAYNDEGNLLPAALGFLKKTGASAEDLVIQQTDKGDVIAVNILERGRLTPDILADWIRELIPAIPFATSMIWNESRLAFSRPLRWLVALWDHDIIPLTCAGISSGNKTSGNRYLGLDARLEVEEPSRYLDLLRRNSVIADREERKECLLESLKQVFSDSVLQVLPDERLADTVTDLVEFPTAVAAEFSPEFLALPEKIITSTISQNQKYFSVLDDTGHLANRFVFISNGDPQYSQTIKRGNEKVVVARLADALWYFREDTKHSLESFLPKLGNVVFQSKLGTLADKAERMEAIAAYICDHAAVPVAERSKALRTVRLCKADLVTTMLGEKEFTKLQGYIGKHYALASGEDFEVAEGIYEHYQPRGGNDTLPQTAAGSVAALSDKLDSVCGIIGVGQIPTGSADPFALRRAANGVVQILLKRDWGLNLTQLIDFVIQILMKRWDMTPSARADVGAFFKQRVEWLLRQAGIPYDVTDAVMHLSLGNVPDLMRRAVALQQYREREEFLRLVIGFKRVANILGSQQELPKPDPSLFEAAEEKDLQAGLLNLKHGIDEALAVGDYISALSLLVDYGRQIDLFFDAVLVNCDDQAVRANRLALLSAVKSEFLRVADISRIVLEIENPEKK